MSDNTVIKTTKIIYPQIYAYTLPTIQDYNGWVKIGYTERKNVDERIKEQTKTAAINLAYDKLWSEPAKFNTSDDWFKGKQLHTYLRRYKNIEQRTNTEWFFYNGTPEKSHADFNDFRNNERSQVKEKLQYTLRNEQEDAVNMTLDYAKKYKGGEFLWNAKPRFGKTLTTYDFIRKLDASKVLIVTNRPAIANSWFDDFEKFIAWQTDYAFVSTSDSLKDRPVMDRDEFIGQMMDGKNKMLAFISLQDLKGAISFGGNHDKLKWVKDLEWDLLVIDESHEGVDTFKTDIAFENINRNFTLHLSGTPFKAVASGKFSDDQIYNWTYADEQEAKADWPIESEENNPYDKMPRLSLFSYQMSQMITDEVNKGAKIDGENIDYAFDLMVELDVNQVLTIPKAIKAQEVVRRGFMSNLLFQNISGIFASAGAREILEQLNPADQGKTVPRKTDDPIDTKDVKVDDIGEVIVEQDIVIVTTEAHFGEKIYADIQATVEKAADDAANNLSNMVATSFKQSTQDAVKELAKENGLTAKAAEQVVQQSANVIAREVETVQKQAEIKYNEAEAEYKSVVAESHNDSIKIAEAKANYEAKKQEIEENFKKEVVATVETKTKELTQKATETVLQKAEEKKKNTVEEDVRARLRGFARTIPSFLMAYGEPTTTLANFETTITDSVFKEVTGITLDQFCALRDTYNFFDPIVFDESCQEFLHKRQELANYFDESQEEDIFDYIPPQQTNQIFTPKKVVKMMVDKLQEESPEDFRNPDKTFVDLYIKSGLYLTEIVKRLYVGLENQIPDKDSRLKHILENQVYGFAPSEIIYNIARNFIFGFDENAKSIDDSHIVYLDTTPFARGEGDFEAKCDELFGGNR